MQLTNKQEQALRIAVERYSAKEKYTCISGYAGSGKTTLIKFIIAAIGVDPDRVAYGAYTGKAATVLRQKGCANATTLHKMLYTSVPKPDGGFMFKPKPNIGTDFDIVVVDEISMVPKSLWEQLLKHSVYILATGDPGQLPPVSKDEDNGVLEHPHIFLDEIMRQAQESEIIRLSMHIREGKPINTFQALGEQVQIFSPSDFVDGMYTWADQSLCATNKKRIEINNYVREMYGYPFEPQVGDKIIGLRNHWEEYSVNGDWNLTNGTIGTIERMKLVEYYTPAYIYDKPIPVLLTDITLEDGDKFINVPIDYTALTIGTPLLTPKQEYLMNKAKDCKDAPYDFTYAYGITCHKAQGSQWDKVLVFEEKFPFQQEEHKRWIYTACTRPADKLVVITK